MAASEPGQGGFLAWMMAPERRGPYLVAPAITVLVVMNIFPLMWSFGLSFYQLPGQPAESRRSFKGLGSATTRSILTDDTVWERFQTTAVIVASSPCCCS